MTSEIYDKLITCIWNVKSLQQISVSKRSKAEEHQLSTDSAFVRTHAPELFSMLADRHVTRLLALFNYTDGEYTVNLDDGNDYATRVAEYKYPEIPLSDLSPIEANELIAELAGVADYLYGGYSDLVAIKEEFDAADKHLSEVTKAILMSSSEWEGEALYNISMDPAFFDARIALNSLVKRYAVALEEGREKYEKLSRMITVMDTSIEATERKNRPEETKSFGKPGWRKDMDKD